MAVLSVFAGVFHFGGGMTIELPAGSEPRPGIDLPQWEVVWRPVPATMTARQLEPR